MPEPNVEMVSTDTPEPENVTAASILAELDNERNQVDEPETTEQTDEDDNLEDGPEEANEDLEDDDDVPSLNDDILAHLSETKPELIKAWSNNWKGLLKVKRQADTFKAEVAEITSDDVTTSRNKILSFVDQIAQHKGITREELLGITDELPDEYLSPKELELDRKYSALESKLSRFEKAENDRRIEAETKAYVERIAPKTIKKVEHELNGFKVTPSMIMAALKANPNEQDPVRAVKRHFVDEIVAFTTETVRKQSSSRGPELLPKVGARGQAASKSPIEYRVADALAELEAERA